MYARQVGDRTLTFLVSGKLWRNSLIMQDLETGTLWSHVTGEALEGELAGTRLEVVPGVQADWGTWSAAHPSTRLLAKSEPVSASRYQQYFDDPEKAGLFRGNWLTGRLPGKTLVHGVHAAGVAVAVTAERLAGGESLDVLLGDRTITMQKQADGGVIAWHEADDGSRHQVDVLEVFWFAWSGFHPYTTVVD